MFRLELSSARGLTESGLSLQYARPVLTPPDKTRSAGRIAVPLEDAPARPPLVPLDVWLTYQQELRRKAEVVVSNEDVIMQGIVDSDVPPTGLAASVTADYEIARDALSRVMLFDKLSTKHIDELAAAARQGAVNAGDYLFREGEDAQSFYVVLDGSLEVLRFREERQYALRHIGRGESIGIFGFFSGQRRAACARAIGDVAVLEVPASALNAVVEKDDAFRHRLFTLYKERLLEGFLGTSRLFADVDSIARGMMIARFKDKLFETGSVLLQPGEVCNLMAVLISGKLLLEQKAKSGQVSTIYELLPGQFVTVTSAFVGIPSRMKIYAEEDATVLMLSQREWSELLRDYPALRAVTSRLALHAHKVERDVFCGHTGVPGL